MYLTKCNQWCKQYTGSAKTKFCYQANNYKSTHGKYNNKKQVPKEALKKDLPLTLLLSNQNGIQDCVITFIEQVDDEKFLRQREPLCAHKLDTIFPNGSSQREIYVAY